MPQQRGQLGVGAPLAQDHVAPVGQLVQDEVAAAIPAPGWGERGRGGRSPQRDGDRVRRALGGPSPVGQDEAHGALAEAHQEAAAGLILQQLLRLPAGRGPEPLAVTPLMASRGPAPRFGPGRGDAEGAALSPPASAARPALTSG